MKDNFTTYKMTMLKIIKRCETQKCHRRINNLYSFLHRWCIDNNGLLKVNAARELFYQKFGMNEEIGLVGMIKCKKCHFYSFEKFHYFMVCIQMFLEILILASSLNHSSFLREWVAKLSNLFLTLHYILCYIFIKTIYQNNEALK